MLLFVLAVQKIWTQVKTSVTDFDGLELQHISNESLNIQSTI